jgi:hypothetical protein
MAGTWGDINASQTLGAGQALRRNAGDNGWEAFTPSGGAFSAGVSGGNTAGTAGAASSRVYFAGGNNITLSQSTNGGSATISVVGVGSGVGANAAGTQTATSGTVVFSNSNNVTFGMNNSSVITASATFNQTAASNTLGMSNLGNTAGTSGVVSGNQVAMYLAGGNNITLSQSVNGSSATVTVSAGNAGGDGYNSAQFTNSTANSTMNILWAGNSNGSGNLTLGLTGSTVTGSAPAGGGGSTHATMWYPYNEGVNVAGQAGQASLGFTPVPTPSVGEEVRIDRVVYPLFFTNSSNSTGSLTASFWMGLYTRTGSSLSLAHSQSTSVSLGWAGNNSSTNQRGIRLMTFGWTTTIPDARYVVGMVSRTTTAGGNATLSQMLVSQLNSNVSGMWDQASNASVQWPIGLGYYSATTSGLPSNVAYSQIRGTNSLAARPPSWHMINGSA